MCWHWLILAASTMPATTRASARGDDPFKTYFYIYLGIGVLICFWWVRDGFDLKDRDDYRAVRFATLMLAPFWPILLLARLANPPMKKKPREPKSRE